MKHVGKTYREWEGHSAGRDEALALFGFLAAVSSTELPPGFLLLLAIKRSMMWHAPFVHHLVGSSTPPAIKLNSPEQKKKKQKSRDCRPE